MNISVSRVRFLEVQKGFQNFITVLLANGDLVEDIGEETIDSKIKEQIENLKQDKATEKSAFTQIKNELLHMVDEQDNPGQKEKKMSATQHCTGTCHGTMGHLSTEYVLAKDRVKWGKKYWRDGQIGSRIFRGE